MHASHLSLTDSPSTLDERVALRISHKTWRKPRPKSSKFPWPSLSKSHCCSLDLPPLRTLTFS